MKNCIVLVCLLFAINTIAQTPLGIEFPSFISIEATPSSVESPRNYSILESRSGVDPFLADTLDKVLEMERKQLNVKALSAAIRLPDGSIWSEGVGLSSEVPIDSMVPEMRLAIGSVTKSLVAAAVMHLYENGALSLNDNIASLDLSLKNVDEFITVSQLLRHKSGIYNYTDHPNFFPQIQINFSGIYSLTEIIDNFVDKRLFKPNAMFSYSNTNYIVLALIIEKVSGQAYYEYIQENILSPIGLDNTFLPIAEEWQMPIGHLWIDSDANGQIDDFHNTFISWQSLLTCISAAGGYYSTPSDLVEFFHALMTGNVLSSSTIDLMKGAIATNLPQGTRYGLGLMRKNIAQKEAFGHQGDISYSTQAWYIPELDISISITCNDGSINSWNLSNTVQNLVNTYIEASDQLSSNKKITDESFKVYPTLANNQIFLESEQIIEQVELFDASGRRALQISDKNINSLIVSDLPKGIYFLKARMVDGQLGMEKVVKL